MAEDNKEGAKLPFDPSTLADMQCKLANVPVPTAILYEEHNGRSVYGYAGENDYTIVDGDLTFHSRTPAKCPSSVNGTKVSSRD
ncbi:MAG: hypothetical protein U1E36_06670 [Rickettsiales bacterium]